MTARQRLLTVMRGEVPDHVPCCPDISNMVPCRLTGKPFWDIYVYQDPPLWKAHVDALRHFGLDGGFEVYSFGSVDVFAESRTPTEESRIVQRRKDGSFVTQNYQLSSGKWAGHVTYHTADNPPANISPAKLGLEAIPTEWEPIVGVKEWPVGMDLWLHIREYMGEDAVLGLQSGAYTTVLGCPEHIYSYYENPELWRERSRNAVARIEKRMEKIAQMNPRPDFLFCGGSGSLIWQTPQIFRELSLPLLKRATEMAYDLGIPTHVHSCGPERALVQMAAEETRLTVVDPLEIPPMGDCDLAELKARYGSQIVLKGNLHTTDVMLRGTTAEVVAASKAAIDAAGAGGRFILSTGDQCGRDTPDANIMAMVETAHTYGRY